MDTARQSRNRMETGRIMAGQNHIWKNGDEPASRSLTRPVPRTKTLLVAMTFNQEPTDRPGRAGLERNLSRVSGNYYARFLGGKDS